MEGLTMWAAAKHPLCLLRPILAMRDHESLLQARECHLLSVGNISGPIRPVYAFSSVLLVCIELFVISLHGASPESERNLLAIPPLPFFFIS